MKIFSPPGRAWRAALAGVLVLLAADGAPAQCTYMGLGKGLPQPVIADPSFYAITPPIASWTAFAVRPVAGEDWDLSVSSTAAAPPACVGAPLAVSERGTLEADVIVGDLNPGGSGSTFYPKAYRYGSGSQPAQIEWEYPYTWDQLYVNGPSVGSDAQDLIGVWQASLTAATAYTVTLYVEGPADFKLLVFENGTGAPVWRNRVSAVLSMSHGNQTYIPAASGMHAFVVVNDNGEIGRYAVAITTCKTPTVLTSGVGALTGLFAHTYFTFTQTNTFWAAVGVHTSDEAYFEFDVFNTGSGAAAPDCFIGLRGVWTFSGPKTGFLMCNFNAGAEPLGSYFVHVIQGGLKRGTVLWADGTRSIAVDGAPWSGTLEESAPMQVCDVYLQAGTPYTFSFSHDDLLDTRVLLFRPGAAPSPWMNDGQQDLEITTSGSVTYTPPASGWYGVLVVSDPAQTSPFTVAVTTCPLAVPLTSGVPMWAQGSGMLRYRFNQQQLFWTAVAARAVRAADNWDLSTYADASGRPAPLCYGSETPSNQGPGVVDFVAADFNHLPRGENYATVTLASGTVPSQIYTEWEQGGALMFTGDPPVTSHTGPGDVVNVWDVQLNHGDYTLYFDPLVGTHFRCFLFQSDPNGRRYFARADALVSGTGPVHFTAPVDDLYGLVVVNETGEEGQYQVAVQATGVSAEPLAPRVTTLRGVRPNPSRGEVTVEFDLAAAAPVAFDLIDVAGRIAARSEPRVWEAGHWSTSWRLDRDERPRAGVYFLRMRAGAQLIGVRRLVVLL